MSNTVSVLPNFETSLFTIWLLGLLINFNFRPSTLMCKAYKREEPMCSVLPTVYVVRYMACLVSCRLPASCSNAVWEIVKLTTIEHVINCDAIIDSRPLHLDSCPDSSHHLTRKKAYFVTYYVWFSIQALSNSWKMSKKPLLLLLLPFYIIHFLHLHRD